MEFYFSVNDGAIRRELFIFLLIATLGSGMICVQFIRCLFAGILQLGIRAIMTHLLHGFYSYEYEDPNSTHCCFFMFRYTVCLSIGVSVSKF